MGKVRASVIASQPGESRQRRLLAGLVCFLIVPSMAIIGGILFRIDSDRYPLSDGPPMAPVG